MPHNASFGCNVVPIFSKAVRPSICIHVLASPRRQHKWLLALAPTPCSRPIHTLWTHALFYCGQLLITTQSFCPIAVVPRPPMAVVELVRSCDQPYLRPAPILIIIPGPPGTATAKLGHWIWLHASTPAPTSNYFLFPHVACPFCTAQIFRPHQMCAFCERVRIPRLRITALITYRCGAASPMTVCVCYYGKAHQGLT